MNQPRSWWIGEICADDAQRFTCDEAGLAEQTGSLITSEISREAGGRNFGAPQDFICHPVPDTREPALEEEHGFDRCTPVTIEETIEERPRECAGANFREISRPPFGMQFAVMESHAAEKPRIAEDKRAFRLPQNQMVVFAGAEIRRLDPHRAAHSEVQPQPIRARELEEHLLPARSRAEQFRAGEAAFQCAHIASAENALLRM